VKTNSKLTETTPTQRLPREAYTSDAWFEREQTELFGKNWAFAGVVMDFADAGVPQYLPSPRNRAC
jgi:phenylpropionate dioxygenase-like ring-hydroxylating dioxygenase large terminal subunit